MKETKIGACIEVVSMPRIRQDARDSSHRHPIRSCEVTNYPFSIIVRRACVDGPGGESSSPPPPPSENFKRKHVAIGRNMLLLLLLKIKGSVTLLSRVQEINIPGEKYPHDVFECVMIIMEPAGSLESTRARTHIRVN